MEYDKIRDSIAQLVAKYTSFREFLKNENYDTLPLTGEYFKFSARDLLYLYFNVCKEHKLFFSIKEIDNYSFLSISKITQLVINSKNRTFIKNNFHQ